jgi:hypothetical protein
MRYCTVLFNGGHNWENDAQLCGSDGLQFRSLEETQESTLILNTRYASKHTRYVTLPESVWMAIENCRVSA